jgi:plastocyanin
MRPRGAVVAIGVGAGAATAALPAAAGTAPRKFVGVHDNFYLPDKLTVKPGTIIVWKWPNDAGDVHDVKLKEKPRRARRFWSDPAAVGYKYKRKLVYPGRYHIVCTLHEDMDMNIVVRRPSG